MSMKVCLQTEAGTAIAEVSDLNDVITSLAETACHQRLEIAHTIDRYGDTVFNRLQVPMLVKDLDRMLANASSEQTPVLRRVQSLAERVAEEPHLYLKFMGD